MSTNKAAMSRPLSPHLTIYRPQISSMTSITHRMTGVGLGLGMVWLAVWLIAAANGPEAFGLVQGFTNSMFGSLLLIGFTWALAYHFLNGIRHLIWDLGYGFDLPSMNMSGYLSIFGSVALTTLIWGLAMMMRGAQ